MDNRIEININTKVETDTVIATGTTVDKIIKCVCGGEMKLNGHYRGKQRYECKICGGSRRDTEETKAEAKIATQERKIATHKYERKEKMILAALYAMLENDFWNDGGSDEVLKEAFKKTNKYYKYIKNTVFDSVTFQEHPRGAAISIKCYQPKLLICVNDGKIRFIQIPPHLNTNADGTPMARVFSINDDKKYKI